MTAFPSKARRRRIVSQLLLLLAPATLALLAGCKQPDANGTASPQATAHQYPLTAGKYTVLGILTDNNDRVQAKSNAEDAIVKYPDIACMVGLWAYNPPKILSAVKDAGKTGQIKIIGFDEDPDTLQGVADGHVHGTIVQQPFLFGYRSVEYLAAMARGEEVAIPPSAAIFVPHRVVRQDNVDSFQSEVAAMRGGTATPPEPMLPAADQSKQVRIAFLTNSTDPFWDLAKRGVELAEPQFNAACQVIQPADGTVDEQQRYMEGLITGGAQGLAISPIDPKNQTPIINQVCQAMPVICQDSDAPESNRKFYLGTSNYLAGRTAGKLVKEALPDGGKLMLLVGKMEAINAQERSAGLIDELLDKPIPAEYQQASAANAP